MAIAALKSRARQCSKPRIFVDCFLAIPNEFDISNNRSITNPPPLSRLHSSFFAPLQKKSFGFAGPRSLLDQLYFGPGSVLLTGSSHSHYLSG
jgi:hypothetical protein